MTAPDISNKFQHFFKHQFNMLEKIVNITPPSGCDRYVLYTVLHSSTSFYRHPIDHSTSTSLIYLLPTSTHLYITLSSSIYPASLHDALFKSSVYTSTSTSSRPLLRLLSTSFYPYIVLAMSIYLYILLAASST